METTAPNPEETAVRKAQQDFLDSFGDVPRYEKTDFEPFVGQDFTVKTCEGEFPLKLKLLEVIEREKNDVGRRKKVRLWPFILEFVAPDSVVLADSNVVLVPASAPERSFFMFVKRLEHIADEGEIYYESMHN